MERFIECFLLFSLSLQIVNSHLMKDLSERGLWNDDMKQMLIKNNGSVQVHSFTVLAYPNFGYVKCMETNFGGHGFSSFGDFGLSSSLVTSSYYLFSIFPENSADT